VFLPYKNFPWFRDATVAQLVNVQWPSPHHLYWPDLDVDLAVESIDHPDKYPLVSAARPNKRVPPAGRRRGASGARRGSRG
jgi:hypothetical protein